MNKSTSPPIPTVQSGLDNWKDSLYEKPKADEIVSGWTGRRMVKCLYDYKKNCWVTPNGKEVRVHIWNPHA